MFSVIPFGFGPASVLNFNEAQFYSSIHVDDRLYILDRSLSNTDYIRRFPEISLGYIIDSSEGTITVSANKISRVRGILNDKERWLGTLNDICILFLPLQQLLSFLFQCNWSHHSELALIIVAVTSSEDFGLIQTLNGDSSTLEEKDHHVSRMILSS